MFGPVDSSIETVGLFESQADWPVAGINSMAYWGPVGAVGSTGLYRLIDPCWLTAFGVGTPVHRVQ
jgi:hypothetical protein